MTQDFPEIDPTDYDDLSPKDVELQMRYLIRELSATQKEYAVIRKEYAAAKKKHTVNMAKKRDEIKNSGTKTTSQEREDMAIIANEEEYGDLLMQEAIVDVLKGKIDRLKTQADLVRSVNSGLKESMKMGDN